MKMSKSIRGKDLKPPWSSMRVSHWPSSTLYCSHGCIQQVRLLRCCWAHSSSSSSREASSNCCLLSVPSSLHLISAIRKSLNRSGAIRITMTTILCVGWTQIYIFRGQGVCTEDRHHATYLHPQLPPSHLSISALPPADI